MRGKDKGDYIRSRIDPLKQERIDQRDEGIAQRAEELKIEIPEGIKNLKRLSNLKLCVHQGEKMQNFAKVFKVASEKIVVLST